MINEKEWEMFSSAFTMSDMEIFVFPELLHAMVIANIMSPQIWEWKNDPWFKNLHKLNNTKKVHRLKQYIIDHFNFNLDLETWGLTKKEKELERFKNFISPDIISESNALFGYEGDKYYFSIDIRKHFGLDKFNSNIIPYWKTETVEAMDAFKFKEFHNVGAGECVSLSALYAAAVFIVLEIPLEDIFLIATPLHSQNFIILGDGFVTNNRRILTKRMWFNGTILSDKARRALENENITYISHISGNIHSVYKDASIDSDQYKRFEGSINNFLHIKINGEIFINFLRVNNKFRKHFQFLYKQRDKTYYITAEKLYEYEHNSKNRIDETSRKKLFEEIHFDDLDLTEHPGRYILNDLESKFNKHEISCNENKSIEYWRNELTDIPELDSMIKELLHFSCTDARLPDISNKNSVNSSSLNISLNDYKNRDEIIEYLESKRDESLMADLAFFAGRYCTEREWPFFLKAAIERNPVTIEYYRNHSIGDIYKDLETILNHSIYDKDQFAQPDEIINYKRGDGLEKAIAMANILVDRNRENRIEISAEKSLIKLKYTDYIFTFKSNKNVSGKFLIKNNLYEFKRI